MIITTFYETRFDGVDLYRTYSDRDMKIQKDGTEQMYDEAIDVADSGYTYTETDIPIEGEIGNLTVDDTLQTRGELGVDTDD